MRYRKEQFSVRLTEQEITRLNRLIAQTGLGRSAFMRSIANRYIPRAQPPVEYHKMIQELQAIGRNINQIAAKANSIGHIDTGLFLAEAAKLRDAVLDIKVAVLAPDRINHGHNKNPESEE